MGNIIMSSLEEEELPIKLATDSFMSSLEFLYYPGDEAFFSLNTWLGMTITLADFLTGLVEFFRAELHTFRPYQSHTEVSGMAEALGLEGKNLDAVAQLT